jgi:UPF0716 protein FxsA
MNPWLLLVVALYVVLEWFVAAWLASMIGWLGVIVVVLALVITGVAVMRRAGTAAFRSLRPVQVDGITVQQGLTQDAAAQVGREVGDAGALFVAGLLIAIPGIVTSVVGLVLLVPPVRRWTTRIVTRRVRRRAEAAGLVVDARTTTTRTTVVGDVVREDTVVHEDVRTDRPVRGEIISGEVVRDDEDRPS